MKKLDDDLLKSELKIAAIDVKSILKSIQEYEYDGTVLEYIEMVKIIYPKDYLAYDLKDNIDDYETLNIGQPFKRDKTPFIKLKKGSYELTVYQDGTTSKITDL